LVERKRSSKSRTKKKRPKERGAEKGERVKKRPGKLAHTSEGTSGKEKKLRARQKRLSDLIELSSPWNTSDIGSEKKFNKKGKIRSSGTAWEEEVLRILNRG